MLWRRDSRSPVWDGVVKELFPTQVGKVRATRKMVGAGVVGGRGWDGIGEGVREDNSFKHLIVKS